MSARDLLDRVRQRPGGTFALMAVTLLILAALLGPHLVPYDPNAIRPADKLLGPSLAHPLGTDHLGRDLLSRLVVGTRLALGVAFSAVALALAGGLLLGVGAALGPRAVDQAIVMGFDVVTAFPSLVLALALVAVVGPGLGNVVLLVGLVFVPHFGRVARAQTIAIRNSTFLEAERVLGAGRRRILFVHVLPNIVGPIAVLAAMDVPVVITIEAGLSFLGLGVRPPAPSWGVLLNDGYTYLDRSAWPATFSGLALILATLGFSLLGEALRDAVDPKLAGAQ